LHQWDRASALYNIPLPLRIRGSFDEAALRAALTDLVARHEPLRTTFTDAGGIPRQVVAPPQPFPLQVSDLSAVAPEERERAVLRLAEEDAAAPFDLRTGPVFRAKLLRVGAEDHVVLLNVHHIAFDGWSSRLFLQELTASYEAHRGGTPATFAPLPVQYADYAAWQRSAFKGGAFDAQLAYWRNALAGVPNLELPTDLPRPPVQSFRGAQLPLRLSPTLLARLKTLAAREGATLFMTLLAGYQALLHRYTGQEDVAVGTPIAGRNREETEGLIGLFVNTLVLRGDLGGDPTFRELLAQARARCLAAYDNQDVPFERIVEEVAPARDPSRTPLFQTMLVLQNAAATLSREGPLPLEEVPVPVRTAKFDLTLTLEETAAGLEGVLEYSTDLFVPETVARLATHFETLLEAAAASPETRLSRLPILTEAERHQVVHAWNATTDPLPAATGCIHERFAAQARETPDRVAVTHGAEALTYSELDERSNRLAHHLRRLGVTTETPVALLVERSLDAVTGILAVLKAGGAYVPLDPAAPVDRLRFMLEDSGARVLLTRGRFLQSLPAPGVPVVDLDTAWAHELAGLPATPPASEASPHHLAYVIYTSGSTGKPKGVCVEHRQAMNLFAHVQRDVYRPAVAGAGRPLSVALSLPLTFDPSVLQLIALLDGHTLQVVDEATRQDAAALVRFFRDNGTDTSIATPAQLPHLEAAGLFAPSPALRFLVVGGDAMDAAQWRRLTGARGIRVIHAYGPTEATVYCTYTDARPGAPLSIGKPIPNARVYVLDRHAQPVPIGVPGELCAAGAVVAHGYHNRPELTAEKFVPDPFFPGERMYRTGDLVRWLPSGELEFLGRLDDQVKIRGFRIELGEIEAALLQQPGVKEAVAVVRDFAPGDKRLVAYIVASDPAAVDAARLKEGLRGFLPEYMIPAAFLFLDQLPLTAHGKVDRKALPNPAAGAGAARAAYEAPRDPVETEVAALFGALLGVERVGLRDGFFELGGHSLLAMQAVARLKETHAVELPLSTLFAGPTVEAVARALREAKAATASAPALPSLDGRARDRHRVARPANGRRDP
ncbi:MAG TPA: amino acid adenylation domain-containing protein, partial [Candidatus Thermoplasmatota archaeon]|nr:amino acid adenylation domain-containing protein [Candidatus Thermoplasmatota archaeon]